MDFLLLLPSLKSKKLFARFYLKPLGTRQDDFYLSLLALLFFLGHFPVIFHFFLTNDSDWILRAQAVAEKRIPLFMAEEDHYRRPVLIGLLACLYPLFRNNFIYYRLFAILLHLTNTFCLYFLFRSQQPLPALSFLTALFFLYTPSHYQETFWFATLPHIFATTTALSSLFCYQQYCQGKKLFLVLSLFFFTGALTSREYMAVLPFILALWARKPVLLFYLFPVILLFSLYSSPAPLDPERWSKAIWGMSRDLFLSFFSLLLLLLQKALLVSFPITATFISLPFFSVLSLSLSGRTTAGKKNGLL